MRMLQKIYLLSDALPVSEYVKKEEKNEKKQEGKKSRPAVG